MTYTAAKRRLAQSTTLAIGALAISAIGGGAWISTAAAAGSTPTTTTIATTSNHLTLGQSDTLTATVSIALVGGIIVTPSGPVDFIAANSSGSTDLGSANLSSCVLTSLTMKSCTASVTTTAIPRGVDTVTAMYGGDSIAVGSSASTTITVIEIGTVADPVVTSCVNGSPCDTGVVYADDGSSTIDVATTASNANNTITSSLGGALLPCSTASTGEIGNYVVSDNKVTQTITYSMLGS